LEEDCFHEIATHSSCIARGLGFGRAERCLRPAIFFVDNPFRVCSTAVSFREKGEFLEHRKYISSDSPLKTIWVGWGLYQSKEEKVA